VESIISSRWNLRTEDILRIFLSFVDPVVLIV
jgi:hypothetical protein